MGSSDSKPKISKRSVTIPNVPYALLTNELLDSEKSKEPVGTFIFGDRWIIITYDDGYVITRKHIQEGIIELVLRYDLKDMYVPLGINHNNLLFVSIEDQEAHCVHVQLDENIQSDYRVQLPSKDFFPYISSDGNLEFIRVSDDRVTIISKEIEEEEFPETLYTIGKRTHSFIPTGSGVTLIIYGDSVTYSWDILGLRIIRGDRAMQDIVGLISEGLFLLEDGTPLSLYHMKLKFAPLRLENGFITILGTNIPSMFCVYTLVNDVEVVELRKINEELRFSWQQV